jgi:catalase
MMVVLPREGDPLLSATAIWPADREQVEVGVLRITGRRSGGRARGVRPGDVQPRAAARRDRAFEDPMLLIRAPAYAVSLSRRLQ